MARKDSIVNRSSLGVFFILLHVAMCKTELTEPLKQREKEESEIESSITSGFRTLELIRRQIVQSRKEREYNRAEPRTYGNSRYSKMEKTGDDDSTIGPMGSRYPRQQVDSAVYEALSKIANVRVADPDVDHFSGRGRAVDETTGRRASQPTFYNSPDADTNKQLRKNVGPTRTLKNEGSISPTSIGASIKLPVTPRKFQCRPIRDIYIPKADKRMPAYLCSLGKRAFVISSERFHQDNRDHFEVSVDEKTFERMNPMNSGPATLTSGVSVLPATLVLKQGENGYVVRGSNKVQRPSESEDTI